MKEVSLKEFPEYIRNLKSMTIDISKFMPNQKKPCQCLDCRYKPSDDLFFAKVDAIKFRLMRDLHIS